MILPDFLSQNQFGEIFLTGHRIGLYTIIRCYQTGFTREKIAEEYPSLPLVLIDNVLAFYQNNQIEVDTYVNACAAEIERQASLPPGTGVRKVRQLLETQQANHAAASGQKETV